MRGKNERAKVHKKTQVINQVDALREQSIHEERGGISSSARTRFKSLVVSYVLHPQISKTTKGETKIIKQGTVYCR